MSEALILGGGLAGGAAAILLARDGAPVRLIEREPGPHDKVCGEFLSIEAQRDLHGLGVDTRRLGAVAIDRVRLIAGSRQVEAALPFVGQGLSRRVLDEALLEIAAGHGARIERGVRVTGLGAGEAATTAGARAGGPILLATGKHDLRGAPRGEAATRDGYVGFKLHWRPDAGSRAALAGAIELVLFDGGYAGLQLVAPEVMNLCLIVRKHRLRDRGGSWDALLDGLLREPHLACRLAQAAPLAGKPLTIAKLPYGFVFDPASPVPAGVLRLGDQAAMTASLTGDGMAAALRSARIAAECLRRGASPAMYHARLRRTVSRQVGRAMLLQRVTESPLALLGGMALLRLWPRLLGALAGATRLPGR